ncbi:MAG: hypothetical protein WBD55_08980 [Dehalococcoidia bacterium]
MRAGIGYDIHPLETGRALVEVLGCTQGSRRNLKVTTPEDLALAQALLAEDLTQGH